MTIKSIERCEIFCCGILISVDWVAIECPADRFIGPGLFLQMNGCDVVVVVVGSPAVTTEIIQFAGQQRVSFTVILDGIENRDAIDSDGDSATEEVGFGRHGLFCGDWIQGNPPGVFC